MTLKLVVESVPDPSPINNLLNRVTVEQLTASFFDVKKLASPGFDGETRVKYTNNDRMRINNLHTRIHRTTYRATPSNRTRIAKLEFIHGTSHTR